MVDTDRIKRLATLLIGRGVEIMMENGKPVTLGDIDIGKRVLVLEIPWAYTDITAVRVIDKSPSGKYVKIYFEDSGIRKWVRAEKYAVVEILE